MATNDLLPMALVTTGTAPAAIPQLSSTPMTAERDQFARKAGPDVSFKGPNGMSEAYTVFSIDPASKELKVMVVDGEGRVIRIVPPTSISQMLESMGRYRPS
jgi:hypothetical protein